MNEVYIAYFDLLGFKEFILKNDDVYLMRRMGNIYRDLETSLSKGKYQKPKDGIVLADISNLRINSLNISDTIILWTNDCNISDLKELIEISYVFNWKQIRFNFPIRGALTKGKIRFINGETFIDNKGTYAVRNIYGKGIVNAHIKAESQDWAGTVIDNSIVQDLIYNDEIDFLKRFAILYNVPYKNNHIKEKEFVFKLSDIKLNLEQLIKAKKGIEYVFNLDNKSVENTSVIRKLNNTKRFLDEFKQ